MNTRLSDARILIVSQRNMLRALFRCPHYEFEDVISAVDSVDIVAPAGNPPGFRRSLPYSIAFHAPIYLNPGLPRLTADKSYDVFLAICGGPQDLLAFHAARHLREACSISVCLIDELWVRRIPIYRHFLRLLQGFDLVLLYYSGTVEPLQDQFGVKCAFLPPGIDTLLFCPYANPPRRVVDIYSIGRKSEVTHRRLLKMVEEEGLVYLYDTIAGDQAIHSADHRLLFANIAKRSRYFIVNPALVDRPDRRGDQIEIGNRYFEGAAAGAIMIGEIPRTPVFEDLFSWPDAVVHLPYDSDEVDQLIHELDRDPERQDQIRRANLANALMRHDWVYRWESILQAVGLQPLPQLVERKKRLSEIADAIGR